MVKIFNQKQEKKDPEVMIFLAMSTVVRKILKFTDISASVVVPAPIDPVGMSTFVIPALLSCKTRKILNIEKLLKTVVIRITNLIMF